MAFTWVVLVSLAGFFFVLAIKLEIPKYWRSEPCGGGSMAMADGSENA
jgi:hypothetical protein